MRYEVVAKKASASYCFGAGTAGGVAAAAALGSGCESEPQPASSSEALKEPITAPRESALLVFMRLPRYGRYRTQFLLSAAAWATMPDDGYGNHPAQRAHLGHRLSLRRRPGRPGLSGAPPG